LNIFFPRSEFTIRYVPTNNKCMAFVYFTHLYDGSKQCWYGLKDNKHMNYNRGSIVVIFLNSCKK